MSPKSGSPSSFVVVVVACKQTRMRKRKAGNDLIEASRPICHFSITTESIDIISHYTSLVPTTATTATGKRHTHTQKTKKNNKCGNTCFDTIDKLIQSSSCI